MKEFCKSVFVKEFCKSVFVKGICLFVLCDERNIFLGTQAANAGSKN